MSGRDFVDRALPFISCLPPKVNASIFLWGYTVREKEEKKRKERKRVQFPRRPFISQPEIKSRLLPTSYRTVQSTRKQKKVGQARRKSNHNSIQYNTIHHSMYVYLLGSINTY